MGTGWCHAHVHALLIVAHHAWPPGLTTAVYYVSIVRIHNKYYFVYR